MRTFEDGKGDTVRSSRLAHTQAQKPARDLPAVVGVLVAQSAPESRFLCEDQVQRQPRPVQHGISQHCERFESQAFSEQNDDDTEKQGVAGPAMDAFGPYGPCISRGTIAGRSICCCRGCFVPGTWRVLVGSGGAGRRSHNGCHAEAFREGAHVEYRAQEDEDPTGGWKTRGKAHLLQTGGPVKDKLWKGNREDAVTYRRRNQ